MKKMLMTLIASAALLVGSGAPADTLSEVVGRWLRANMQTPDEQLRERLPAEVERFVREGNNVGVVVDGGLSRDGRGAYLVTWGGRMLVLALEDEWVRLSGCGVGGATVWKSSSHEATTIADPLPITLGAVSVEHADALSGDTEVRGTLRCELKGKLPAGQLVLRTMHRADGIGVVKGLRFLEEFPAEGKLEFSVEKLNSAESPVHFGPMVIVVDLVATDANVKEGVVVSNATGVVVNLLPDVEGYVRSGVELFKDVTAVLEKVTDKASAAEAVKAYKEIMIRNQALARALERLGVLKPEDEERMAAKYGDQINQAMAKFQEQYERLGQADYAGDAFFDALDAAAKEAGGGT